MIVLSYKGFINIGLSFPLNGRENKNKVRRYFNNGIPDDPKTEAPFNCPAYLDQQGNVRCVLNYIRCITTLTHSKTMN